MMVYIYKFYQNFRSDSHASLEDGYDKINELSNFKCNLVSCFDKLKDTANEISSKKLF